jgi:DNA-binding NarL/FixJ family response regulator
MRAVIVEDQALLREGMAALLQENDIEVVAQAEDGPGLLRILDGHSPDLAICDVRLPPTFTDEGIRAALEARRRHPELAVLVLSQFVEPAYTAELLQEGKGGIGYLLKERVSEVRTFVEAVQRVAAGGTALDREVVSTLVSDRRSAPSAAVEAIETLSARERETLERVAQGRSNVAIARELVVTAPSRSTSPRSSPSSTGPPPMTATGACSPSWHSCVPRVRTARVSDARCHSCG